MNLRSLAVLLLAVPASGLLPGAAIAAVLAQTLATTTPSLPLASSVAAAVERTTGRLSQDAADEAAARAVLAATGDKYARLLPRQTAPGAARVGVTDAQRIVASGPAAAAERSLGIAVVKDSARGYAVTITAVFERSGAFEAGARVGDVVVSVNGVKTSPTTSLGALAAAVGRADTAAIVVARSGASAPLRLTLPVRDAESVTPPAVSLAAKYDDGRTAYLKLDDLGPTSASDVARSLAAVGPTENLIVDLRGNPGGLLDQAIDVVSLLLPPRPSSETPPVVVRVVDRDGEVALRAEDQDPDAPPPPRRAAVLVDGGTKSAAEAMAGALQDLGAAAIVGPSASYGKGSAQSVVAGLGPAGDRAVVLTTAQFRTPAGRPVDGVGIVPNVRVAARGAAADPDADPVLFPLLRDGAFFEFAGQFQADHPGSTSEALEAALADGDDLLARFVAFSGGDDGAAAEGRKRTTLALIKEAIRSRYLPRHNVLYRALADDEVLAAARQLLLSESGYRKALAPPTKVRAPPAKVPVQGYDASAACLPLQTCDEASYAYVRVL